MAAIPDRKSFKVLIAGAGIAGLATAISLSRIAVIPDLELQLYEQAPELSEIGASIAISLSPNGMRTLEKLAVRNALSDEIGFRGPNGIPQIFRHWKTNQVVSVDTHRNVPNPHHHTTCFRRGHLHAALLEHVPRQSIHLSKKLLHADAYGNDVVLYFEDGTTAHGDTLIGLDGPKSRVLQSFIPHYKLRFTGKISMRSTFDASLVVGKVPDLPEDSLHWDQYITVGAYSDPRQSDEVEKTIAWDARGSVSFLRERYKNWHPLIRALPEANLYTNLYPNFAGDAISTWVFKDRVTLVGDAAHAHGNRLAFSKGLFGIEGVKKALELYKRTRKPHTHQLLEIVHAQLNTKPAATGSEEEDEKLINRMKGRPDTEWLSEHDVEKAFAHVVRQEEDERVRALAVSGSKI
ncbi:uncharacterized protein BDW70DRAFT_168881 [Aspergillus foveolatus]|uniref:uncharacterized protein n=1 Tax=Aspergillus foveolatus TaxID=210207 RepID=UPI003CCD73F7